VVFRLRKQSAEGAMQTQIDNERDR
jgi:hypothetical protein